MTLTTKYSQQTLTVLHLAFIFTYSSGNNAFVHAYPQYFTKRDDPPKPSVPSAIWTPAVIIFVVFVTLAVLGCFGRALIRRRAANAAATTTDVATITATQLAGTINGQTPAANGADAARRPRRNRRPRRTPSQMSVTSLPEYMKDPGDEEVVVFRGQSPDPSALNVARDQPAATVVDHPSDDEDDMENPGFRSRNGERGLNHEQYTPMPASPNTMPLLEQDQAYTEVGGQSATTNGNYIAGVPLQEMSQVSTNRQSRQGMSGDVNSLSRIDSNITQASLPLGPAPSYFEVIGDDEPLGSYYPPSSSVLVLPSMSSSNVPLLGATSSLSLATPAPAVTPAPGRVRPSGIRTFFNRMSISRPVLIGGQQHQRNQSAGTNVSIAPRRVSVSTHRSNPSTSNLPFHHRHSVSASQSFTHLTSPSMISLNSISAPLTHTASRTQFMFPNSKTTGLPTMTPEQLKIIASKEAIGRFGVPYGPDAVAFSAMASQEVLLTPPPDFGDVVAGGSGSGTGEEEEQVRSGSMHSGTDSVEEDQVDIEQRGHDHEPTITIPSSTTAAAMTTTASTATEPPPPSMGETEPHIEPPSIPASSSIPILRSKSESRAYSEQKQQPQFAVLRSKTVRISSHSSTMPPPPPLPSTTTISEFGQVLQLPPLNFSKPLSSSISSLLHPDVVVAPTPTSSIYSFRTYVTAEETSLASRADSRSSAVVVAAENDR